MFLLQGQRRAALSASAADGRKLVSRAALPAGVDVRRDDLHRPGDVQLFRRRRPTVSVICTLSTRRHAARMVLAFPQFAMRLLETVDRRFRRGRAAARSVRPSRPLGAQDWLTSCDVEQTPALSWACPRKGSLAIGSASIAERSASRTQRAERRTACSPWAGAASRCANHARVCEIARESVEDTRPVCPGGRHDSDRASARSGSACPSSGCSPMHRRARGGMSQARPANRRPSQIVEARRPLAGCSRLPSRRARRAPCRTCRAMTFSRSCGIVVRLTHRTSAPFRRGETTPAMNPEAGPADARRGRARLLSAHAHFEAACRDPAARATPIHTPMLGAVTVEQFVRFMEIPYRTITASRCRGRQAA